MGVDGATEGSQVGDGGAPHSQYDQTLMAVAPSRLDSDSNMQQPCVMGHSRPL